MPITAIQKSDLQTAVTNLELEVNALVVDTVDIAALQAELAAVKVERDSLRGKIAAAISALS